MVCSCVAVQQVLPIIRGNETARGSNYVTLAGKKKRSVDAAQPAFVANKEKRSSEVRYDHRQTCSPPLMLPSNQPVTTQRR